MGHGYRLSGIGVIANITSRSETGAADIVCALTARLEYTFALLMPQTEDMQIMPYDANLTV